MEANGLTRLTSTSASSPPSRCCCRSNMQSCANDLISALKLGIGWRHQGRSLISTLLGHSSLILERHPADGIAIYTSTNNVVLKRSQFVRIPAGAEGSMSARIVVKGSKGARRTTDTRETPCRRDRDLHLDEQRRVDGRDRRGRAAKVLRLRQNSPASNCATSRKMKRSQFVRIPAGAEGSIAGEFWRSLISTLLGHSSLILERHPADGIAIYTYERANRC
jgi:hypothetical protein